MGFFDFIGDAVGAIKNIVSHTPIVQTLGSLAGVVAHAIPTVGPLIDAAVPAASAIFSKDVVAPSTPDPPKDPKAPPPPTLAEIRATDQDLQKPIMSKLDHQDEEIQKIINNFTNLNNNISRQLDDYKASVSGVTTIVTTTIDTMMDELIKKLNSDKYKSFLAVVNTAARWMKDSQTKETLVLDANSSHDQFNTLFKGDDNIIEARKQLLKGLEDVLPFIQDADQAPAQDMLDLYLTGLHWLLIFDKAFIIARGMEAKRYYADSDWESYLTTLSELNGDIVDLHVHAFNGREDLAKIIDRWLPAGSSGPAVSSRADKIIAASETTGTGTGAVTKITIKDSWVPLTIGYMDVAKVKAALKLGNAAQTAHNSLTLESVTQKEIVLSAWQDLADQALDFHLRPTRVVIQNLEENMRQWQSRIPVKPAALKGGKSHVEPEKGKNSGTADAPPPSIFRLQGKAIQLAGKSVRYAQTYVNAFGESTASEDSGKVDIEEHDEFITLTLHPITIKNDPLKDVERLQDKDGQPIEPGRGMLRRIYVRIADTDTAPVTHWLAEVTDKTTTIVHHLRA